MVVIKGEGSRKITISGSAGSSSHDFAPRSSMLGGGAGQFGEKVWGESNSPHQNRARQVHSLQPSQTDAYITYSVWTSFARGEDPREKACIREAQTQRFLAISILSSYLTN